MFLVGTKTVRPVSDRGNEIHADLIETRFENKLLITLTSS